MKKILTGSLVLLRAPEPSDLEVMYKWENDPSNWFISGTDKPFSKYTLEEYIKVAYDDIYATKQLRFVIQSLKGNPVGFIDLFDFDPQHMRAGIGILIGENENRKKGYASESLLLLCRYAFNVLNLHQVYCHVPVSNEASIRLFAKTGFMKSAEMKDWLLQNGSWESVWFMQCFNGRDLTENDS